LRYALNNISTKTIADSLNVIDPPLAVLIAFSELPEDVNCWRSVVDDDDDDDDDEDVYS
jgi:hypothetical protein